MRAHRRKPLTTGGGPLALLALLAAPTVPGQAPPIPPIHQSVTITATPVEPRVDRRNGEVFRQTLFGRDDQIFHLLDGGINAGQHEGGGKSVEIRRFGFNLDHGGASGGLKVLVDNVPQNLATHGHGQGYLGGLKTITPELVADADIVGGPFNPEYGDFSGLGVVHIRLRESLPEEWTLRVQRGAFGSARTFLAYSPYVANGEALLAYEGSYSNGPFARPLAYRRHNATGSFGRTRNASDRFTVRFNGGTGGFDSSGQLPLDEVAAGRLDRFGFIDPSNGGRMAAGNAAGSFRREMQGGAALKLDGYVSRSLLDLYSNFTFYRDDPVLGDGIQQHDSRLREGASLQYLRPRLFSFGHALLTAGGDFHASQINTGLSTQVMRVPLSAVTFAHVRLANGGGYIHEGLNLLSGRLQFGGGLRHDFFHFGLEDRLDLGAREHRLAGEFQPKANVSFRPVGSLPFMLHAVYGRGVTSLDARTVTRTGRRPVARTGFGQFGASVNVSRIALVSDLFWIDRSNELVYFPDDGSFDFKGPSRSYGFEVKMGIALTQQLSLNAGLTKVANAYYRGTAPRVYLDSAPRLAASSALTLSDWKGWSGSLRMRTINRYRLDGEDPSILASGQTVFDLSLVRRISRSVDFNLTVDNLLDRDYYETQN
jgi:hypothetical protein